VGTVTGLFGEEPAHGEPVASCVAALEDWLEMARAGEIVGVVLSGVMSDNRGCQVISGIIGSYALLGAVSMARATLEAEMREMGQD
jgi:hypothetical protein